MEPMIVMPYRRDMASETVGALCRRWRHLRRRSQLDLSLDVGVSNRHLSFVETGKSRPSRELVLALGRHLDIPLREQNHMLLTAGYAPDFAETALDAPESTHVRAAVRRMLDAHEPFPGLAVDGGWDVVLANVAAVAMLDGLPEPVLSPSLNVYRVSLHPEGLAGHSPNFDEWGPALVEQLRRSLVLTARPALQDLYDEVTAYPNVTSLAPAPATPELLLPVTIDRADGSRISLITTIATFGTPHDVTVDELAIELFFPADPETEQLLRSTG